jgi:hypothetical protein
MSHYKIHVDRFDVASDLTGKKRTYAAVKERVVAEGRYSIFEATENDRNIGIFSQIDRDPELQRFQMDYPWIGIRRRDGKPEEK